MNDTNSQTNWAGNVTYEAARRHEPETVDEVRRIVRGAAKVRAVGTRHSFNRIADTPEDLLSTARLDRVVARDRERGTVTVEAGIRYGTLAAFLHAEGFALHNMASLPHISVGGAIATGTHGSGDRNGSLATAVMGLEMVTGDGEIVSLSREHDPDVFPGAVVALGALGVVTRLTLRVEPAFTVRQDVYERLSPTARDGHLDEIMASAYSVSIFTHWPGQGAGEESADQVWLKRRVENDGGDAPPPPPELFGAPFVARERRHPIAALPGENCTEQRDIPGPWHERLPHFRMGFTPSSGEELQSEYLVPRAHAVAAVRAVDALRERIVPLLQVSEIRSIAGDDLWLSPCVGRDTIGLHFTWKKDWPGVRAVLPEIEAVLAPFDARPHWGKLFTMDGTRLRPLYQKLPDFERLARRFDPTGKFRNAFLDDVLG